MLKFRSLFSPPLLLPKRPPIGEQGDSAFSTVGISDDQLRLRKVDVFDPALQDFSKS
jgi:hypothetical protein